MADWGHFEEQEYKISGVQSSRPNFENFVFFWSYRLPDEELDSADSFTVIPLDHFCIFEWLLF